jgi:hypothetical protein
MKRTLRAVMLAGLSASLTLSLVPYTTLGEPCPQSQEFGILTDRHSAGDYGFDFDGRFVVWRDTRGPDQEIYAYDLLLKKEIKVSEGPAGYKYHCRVSGGLVVWLRTISGDHCEIWGKDLTGRLWPSDAPPRMIKDVDGASTIDLDGDWLVSSENHFGGCTADLYALNLRTGETFPIPGPATEWHLLICGNLVFYNSTPCIWDWAGAMDWDVWSFRLDSPTAASFPVKVGPGNYQVLSADGDYILLEEVPSYYIPPLRKLWLRNMRTGEETLLATGANFAGALSGNRVVYVDDARQVIAYDISSGQRCSVSVGLGGDIRLERDTAVWIDLRPPAGGGGWFIYGSTFADTTPPILFCPADIAVSTAPGQCSAVVEFTVTATDNSGTVTVACNPPSGSAFEKGTTTVTCTATDGAGNAATCSFTVTVNDVEKPSISAPAAVLANTDAGKCEGSGVNLGTPATADNCGVSSVANDAPVVFPKGETVVTWTVTDTSGNQNTATQTVTVEDRENPAISAPADLLVVSDTGLCTASGVVLGAPTTADNCAVASVANDHPSTTFPLGETVVTWTVTDTSGNTAIAVQKVTVLASVSPTFLPPLAGQPVANKIRHGQVVPHKVTLANCSGASVTAGVTVKLKVQGIDSATGQVFQDVPEDANGVGSDGTVTSDGIMVFNDGKFQFNLDTSNFGDPNTLASPTRYYRSTVTVVDNATLMVLGTASVNLETRK